jgi:hypothetical protein
VGTFLRPAPPGPEPVRFSALPAPGRLPKFQKISAFFFAKMSNIFHKVSKNFDKTAIIFHKVSKNFDKTAIIFHKVLKNFAKMACMRRFFR